MAKLRKHIANEALRSAKKLARSARTYLQNEERLNYLLKEAIKRARSGPENFSNVWDELKTLARCVMGWRSGEYRKIPRRSVVAIVAGIIYFVNPFDVVPDFVPGVGYADDATVLAWVLKMVSRDLAEFKKWEGSGE